MKTKTINYGFLSFLAFFCSTLYGQNNDKLPKQASDTWYKVATENLLQNEYAFKQSTTSFVYRTVNPKNQLDFLIRPDGFSVHGLKQAENIWNVNFQLKEMNKNGKSLLPGNFTTNEKNDRLVFVSPVLDIEYINNSNGLRQNF